MEWQPIETAPEDGSPILLGAAWEDFNVDADEMEHGWLTVSGQRGTSTIFGQTGDWWADNGAGGLRLPFEPTHWQPLPAPPSTHRE